MPKKTPEKWNKNKAAVKAIQVAFELEKEVTQSIKLCAVENDLTPSAQIRKTLGLGFTPPKRPRLTASFSEDDYAFLGEKYGIDPKDIWAIKREIIKELASCYHHEPT